MQSHPSADLAVAAIRSGSRVFIHGAMATPTPLIDALVARAAELRDVELMHLHTEGPARYADPEFAASFRVANLFVGANLRRRIDEDRVAYLPCFLSEMPRLLRSGKRPIDVALIQVSAPDAHGYVSLGTSVDVMPAAIEAAKTVIAWINPKMPRVHGDGLLPLSAIDHAFTMEAPLPTRERPEVNEIERGIARNVAALIEDGATLQMGIGSIPDAVCEELRGHKHLGIHTETWSDGALSLIECGAVDNSQKRIHPGKTVSSFLMGSQRLLEFVHDNPSVLHLDVAYVNDPSVIARNHKVVAINSCVEIDLSGQVCADSIGAKVISGVGGQLDFMRGAAMSAGGKPIIALPSRTKNGKSRIVATLAEGAGVVTTRAHVHHVVTEFGRADLFGLTLAERARALIELAHPGDRDALTAAAREVWGR